MRILFVDDEIENVKNLTKKILSFNFSESPIFSLFLINENANKIIYEEKNDLVSLGFFEEALKSYEISEYDLLKKELINNASQHDVIIFDRQLQTNEIGKDGIDLLKNSLEILNENCVYYLIVSKEARKEGVMYDDIKRMGIDVKNYIDNTEKTSNDLDKVLKERLKYFSDNLFLKDIKINNEKIVKELSNRSHYPHFETMENLEIKSNLNFAFSLLTQESNELPEGKIYGMVVHFYQLTLEKFVEYGKNDFLIIKAYNENIKVGKELYPFLKSHKPITKNENRQSPRPTAQQKIIAYSVDDKFYFGDKLNTIRNDSIHLGYSNLFGVVFVNLTLALFVLKRKKDINYKLILNSINQGFIQDNERRDLHRLLDYIQNPI